LILEDGAGAGEGRELNFEGLGAAAIVYGAIHLSGLATGRV
jgi:hypothetical protein